MSDPKTTGARSPISPLRWAVAAWRGAKVVISRLVVELGKTDDEDRARDHEERVFHPRKRGY